MNHMKPRILSLVFVLPLIALLSCESKKNPDSKELAKEQNEEKFQEVNLEKDSKFAVEAADGSMLEIQLGKLAQQKARSAEVKKLGQMMVDDHTKANEELKAIAAKKNITLPQSMSDKHQKRYNELAEKSGAEFDKEYVDFMVKDHKDDIDEFKDEAEKGNDAELKAWAAAKVPTLQHHLETAQRTQEGLQKTTAKKKG